MKKQPCRDTCKWIGYDYIEDENGQTIGVSISIIDRYSGSIVIGCSTNGKTIEKTVYIRTV